MKLFASALNSVVAAELSDAVYDREHVCGQTHNFYRYPARFSPKFAAAAIKCLSRPGELVLDPYMGGGTVVVEALAAGRRVVGNDINSIATFVTKVKTTPLEQKEVRAVRRWAKHVLHITYRASRSEIADYFQPGKMKNMDLIRARFIKKLVASILASISSLPTPNSQNFARCVLLRTAQWALDGRRKQTSLSDFRERLACWSEEMLQRLASFGAEISNHLRCNSAACVLVHGDAADIPMLPTFDNGKHRVSLVVTSPPYPGVHVLYHRWQVDGRRESPAPYWIINGVDGETASFYTFGDRRQSTSEPYFINSLRTLSSIRRVMRRGGFMVQLLAFADPTVQFDRYLTNMNAAGFEEVPLSNGDRESARIWRDVPNRKWHAASQGRTHSAREVVIVHQAV